MADKSDVYAGLLKCGKRVPLPDPWERHARNGPHLVELPNKWDKVLARLRQQFAEDDLVASGMLQQHEPGGGCCLAGHEVLPIYNEAGGAPVQFLCEMFCFPRDQPHYMSLLEDVRCRSLLPNTVVGLAVTHDLLGATILLNLGIPAIPFNGLHQIDVPGLRAFEQQVSHAKGSHGVEQQTPLVLVGCNLATLAWNLEPSIALTADHLRRLQQHLQVGPQVSLWQPNGAGLEALQTALRFGDTEILRQHLLWSFEREAMIVPSDGASRICRRVLGTGTRNIAGPLRDWIDARQLDRFSRQPVMQRLERERNAELVEPLLEMAEQAADPIERNLLVGLAHTCRLLHDLAARLAYYWCRATTNLLSGLRFQRLPCRSITS